MVNKKNLILSFALLMTVGNLGAQQIENQRIYYTFAQLQNANAWLQSQNAAGLSTYDQEDFTQAYLQTSIEDGGLRNVYSPESRNDYRLNMQSYHRINKVMLYGRFLFDYDLSKNQNWTSMTNPGSSPLHIGDATPGKQTRETYFIDGGVGVPVWKNLVVGGYFDFTGISTAKKKDIRNKNTYSQYHISPSLMWEQGPFRIGASYRFGSEVEDIEWKTFGDAMQHEVFYFQGLWFGPSERTTGNVTGRRYERNENKGALQLEYHTSGIRFFNEISLSEQKQKAYLIVEDERGGENRKVNYEYNGQLGINRGLFKQTLCWNAGHDFLKNYENLQQRELVDFIYRYVQYGTLLRYTESNWNTGLHYELFRKRTVDNDWKMNWRLTLEAGYDFRDQRFRTYPNSYQQQINRIYVNAGFEKNFSWKRGMLDMGLQAGYRSGWGTPVSVVENETNGYQFRADLQQQEYDYLAANVAAGKLQARYTYFLNSQSGLSSFAHVSYRYDKATSGNMKGRGRSFVDITLGLNF
ncbi:MAG: DUF6850 family outer membrane beta-barrel protein [Bacteroidales bacterium]